jgi:hypothetical protein
MAVSPDILEKLREETPGGLDLSWLEIDNAAGVHPRPGRRGLTLDEIEVGAHGEVPATTTNASYKPRGAVARPDAPRTGLTYGEKDDVWSNNVRLLYEEAIQRQWSSATDIPWETIEPLPDDIERAMCQMCTFLTEVEFIAGDAPGQWMPRINPEYHEVKLFLLTQINDEARHLDVFRKRALANGGGLLEESVNGPALRIILDAQDFTEMSSIMHVFAEGFVQSLFRTGELVAQNEAEKRIYRLCAQDESRHVAFGVMHLKHIMETQPWRREEIHHYLDRIEVPMVFDFNDPPAPTSFDEALMILAGGGRKGVDEGFKKLMAIRKRQVNEYMHRLEVAGLGDRRERMHPFFRPFLDPPRN